VSDTRDPETDQQLPTPNAAPYVQDEVIADIEERKQHGIRKYGTALQAGNGRDMLRDAYEEALDLAIYLRGALDEQGGVPSVPAPAPIPVLALRRLRSPEGHWDPVLEDRVREALRKVPNMDAPWWIGPSAAIGVVEDWLLLGPLEGRSA
jgi:hypothetical protein